MEARTMEIRSKADMMLYEALEVPDLEKAEEAIRLGANPLRGGYRLFELALLKGRRKIVEKMVELGSREKKRVLHAFATQACQKKQVGVLRELQRYGAVIRVDDRFVKENQETVQWMINAEIKAKVLGDAITYAEKQYWNNPKLLGDLILLMKKSETHQKYMEILDFLLAESAKRGKLSLVKYYERLGGNLKDIPNMYIIQLQKEGETVLLAYLEDKGVKIPRLF